VSALRDHGGFIPALSGLPVILEELKKSLLNNSFFGEASDAIFCIPVI
jgi:hypothetical protein